MTKGAGLSWFGLNGRGVGVNVTNAGGGVSVTDLQVQVNPVKGTGATAIDWTTVTGSGLSLAGSLLKAEGEIGRASCRERVKSSVGSGSLKKKMELTLAGVTSHAFWNLALSTHRSAVGAPG